MRSNGDYYIGDYKDNKIDGYGKLKIGENLILGQFKAGKRHGIVHT